MSNTFDVEINTEKRNELADFLETRRSLILEKWIQQPRAADVLKSKKINPVFFNNHFGSRILDHFIGELKADEMVGSCPVVIVMVKFFAKRHISLDEVYRVYSGVKNSVIHTLHENGTPYSDYKIAAAIEELFDINFSGVIREYQEIHCDKFKPDVKDKIVSSSPVIYRIPEAAANFDKCSVLEEYSIDAEEDPYDKILFRTEDADDLMEYFHEISDRISIAMIHSDPNEISAVADIFSRTSSILLNYSPYLDSLAASMNELSTVLLEHTDIFMKSSKKTNDTILKLFDAVSHDMDNYIERFTIENIAMKNAHSIHEPIIQSVRQIISMLAPDQIEDGEIEFF